MSEEHDRNLINLFEKTEETNIRKWYADKNIFITGATGYVGIALLEKLLRAIPDIGSIYLLLRPKRGKSVSARLYELQNSSVFHTLSKTNNMNDVFKNVLPIVGDVSEHELGISPRDRQFLMDHVDVIFHSAATLDFDEALRDAVDVNLLGTRRCLALAMKCKKLKSFVHVSSAFVNSYKTSHVLEEVIYPLPSDLVVDNVLKMMQTMSETEIDAATPEILGKHINSYTITKHMAEFEVQKCQEMFPCTIIRPSIILAAWIEPVPGWIASKHGPSGLVMGAEKGIIRRAIGQLDFTYDYIPIDIVVNQLIVAACYASVTNSQKVNVYHCTTSSRNPFKWRMGLKFTNKALHKYPLRGAVWYPEFKFVNSMRWYKYSSFFVHWVPATILDTITHIMGGEPLLQKLHRHVNKNMEAHEYILFHEWIFNCDKTKALYNWMNWKDQEDFNLDVSTLVWPQFIDNWVKGIRIYLWKEKLSNLAAATTKHTLLKISHYSLKASMYFVMWMLTGHILNLPLIYILFSFLLVLIFLRSL